MEVKLSREHLWLKEVHPFRFLIGITSHVLHHWGEIVGMELPSKGLEMKKGEPIGTVETEKSVHDLYAPLSGKIVEVNPKWVNADQERLKNFEFWDWIFVIDANESHELTQLMTVKEYEDWIKEEPK